MQAITTTHGTWTAEIYEIASTPFERNDEDDGWDDIRAGVNIKLSFVPSRQPSRVRLLAFKYPLIPRKWAVDRARSYLVPWMGFRDQNQLITLPDIGLMQSLQPLVGTARAQEGTNTAPAFIIDTVREPARTPPKGKESRAVFTTFAYDFNSSTWLGGVSWGYTVYGPTERNSAPRIEPQALSIRYDGAPHGIRDEEGQAIIEWNSRRDIQERVPDA